MKSEMGQGQAQRSVALGVLAGRCSPGLSLLHARSQRCHASPATSASCSQTSSPLSQLSRAPALPGGIPGDPSKARRCPGQHLRSSVPKQGKSTSAPEAAQEKRFCSAHANKVQGEVINARKGEPGPSSRRSPRHLP